MWFRRSWVQVPSLAPTVNRFGFGQMNAAWSTSTFNREDAGSNPALGIRAEIAQLVERYALLALLVVWPLTFTIGEYCEDYIGYSGSTPDLSVLTGRVLHALVAYPLLHI